MQAKEAPRIGEKRKPNGDDDDDVDDERDREGGGSGEGTRTMTAAERAEKEAAGALRQSATQAHARLRSAQKGLI
jgi:hypothetical protein